MHFSRAFASATTWPRSEGSFPSRCPPANVLLIPESDAAGEIGPRIPALEEDAKLGLRLLSGSNKVASVSMLPRGRLGPGGDGIEEEESSSLADGVSGSYVICSRSRSWSRCGDRAMSSLCWMFNRVALFDT